MTLDYESVSVEKTELLAPPSYPHLEAYCQKVLSHEKKSSFTTEELLQFFAAKHPNPDNQADIRYLPRVESMLHGLRNIPKDSTNFLNNLRDYGFVASFDGIKIALIDQTIKPEGPNLADAVILGNLELILQTAEALDLEIVVGMYSGDENIALIAPKHNSNESHMLAQAFDTLLQANAKAFYSKPFFSKAQQTIQNYYPSDSVGLRGRYTTAKQVNIYNPKRYVNGTAVATVTHAKQALGSTIDATEGKGLPTTNTTTTLLDYLEHSLTYDLNLITDSNSLELEEIFPDELAVRKIALLQSDLNTSLTTNPDSEIYLIRFADILMKHTNKIQGHTKGDHHMIATARILRRFLNKQNIPPDAVKIYQHHGSFILTTDKETYDLISPILSDPISFNSAFVALEDARTPKEGQDPRLRANPYIVATSKVSGEDGSPIPVTINKDNLNKLWEKVREIQFTQLNNETLVALYSSGLALSLVNDLQQIFDQLFSHFSLKSSTSPLDLEQYRSLKFAELFNNYYTARPQNLGTLFRSLIHKKLIHLSDFHKLREGLRNRLTNQ